MRSKIVPISNVARLAEAGDALLHRASGMPGMGLVFGPSGFGKTTAIAWLATRQHGVFVRALAATNPSSLLESICRELGIARRASNAATVESIVEKLAETGRPLFVDEADYLVENHRLIETLRDIHDLASVPVILIGMAGIQRKITKRPQLAGRIAQWVEFQPATLEDAKALARELAEVSIQDELVEQLFNTSGGSIRLCVVGLSRIEQLARAKGIQTIGVEHWPRGADFFLGSAPRPAGKRLETVS